MLQKRGSSLISILSVCGLVLGTMASFSPLGHAAEVNVNLDDNPTNGEESRIETNVLQSYPVEVENVIFNNVAGGEFSFFWPGAGPGGFESVIFAGPGVGVRWHWSTVSQVYPILSPATFTREARVVPVFGAPPGGIPSGTGDLVMVFDGVPGRSIFPTQVTVSSASLTSSLITFFSPDETVATCESSFADGVFRQVLTNNSLEDLVIAYEQQDCCPFPQMTICDDGCQFYLTDENNCGGCGIECDFDEFCDGGACQPICPAGQALCGELCVDLANDPSNCGDCGIECAFDEFCGDGICQPICPEGQSLCGEFCVDLQTDPANCGDCGIACAADEFCGGGICQSICPEGQTLCGEECVDLASDPLNCGECGNVCGSNDICTGAMCETCHPPLQTACDNVCVNIHTDPLNCGECGNVCDFSDCPSTGTGTCSMGTSCICDPPEATSASTVEFAPIPTSSKTRLRAASFSRTRGLMRQSPKRTRVAPVATSSTRVAPQIAVEEAPVCDLAPVEQVIPAGESYVQCQTGSPIGTEVFLTASVMRDGEMVATGPCAAIVPAPDPPVEEFRPAVAGVVVNDQSGDSLIQPGEAVDLYVSVQNVGIAEFRNAFATFSSNPDEFNTLELTVLNETSTYPDFPAFVSTGDCETPSQSELRTNDLAFSFVVPPDQETDVGRVVTLTFQGDASARTVVEMPFVLGIGDACDPETDIDGVTYDGLQGFLDPVNAHLVPEGYPVNVSDGNFNSGSTVPLKLKLLCGSEVLGPDELSFPPRIVKIDHETLGPQPLENINADNNANPNDPFFVCGSNRCEYQLRTEALPIGIHYITVEMPGSRRFVAGIEIRP